MRTVFPFWKSFEVTITLNKKLESKTFCTDATMFEKKTWSKKSNGVACHQEKFRKNASHCVNTCTASCSYKQIQSRAFSVEQFSQHGRITHVLKSDLKLAICSIKRAAECGISFDQFLKPMQIPAVTFYTDASLNWTKNNWNAIQSYRVS